MPSGETLTLEVGLWGCLLFISSCLVLHCWRKKYLESCSQPWYCRCLIPFDWQWLFPLQNCAKPPKFWFKKRVFTLMRWFFTPIKRYIVDVDISLPCCPNLFILIFILVIILVYFGLISFVIGLFSSLFVFILCSYLTWDRWLQTTLGRKFNSYPKLKNGDVS